MPHGSYTREALPSSRTSISPEPPARAGLRCGVPEFTWRPANEAADEHVAAVFDAGGSRKCRCQWLETAVLDDAASAKVPPFAEVEVPVGRLFLPAKSDAAP